MKTKMLTLLAVAALVAGCGGADEPADPPPSDRALTTSEAAPVTDAPSTEARDDVIETSAAPDVNETTKASGPPELPSEAQEDSEAGAAAFAEHYIEMINYTSMYPEVGLLDALSSDECEVCTNFEATVAKSTKNGEISTKDVFEITDTVSLYRVAESAADVRVTTKQLEQDIIDAEGSPVEHIDPAQGVLAFSMSWDTKWTVDDLRIEVISP